MIEIIKDTVNTQNTTLGKAFDLFFQGLIAISVLLITLGSMPEFQPYKGKFEFWENVILGVFVFEYGLRVFCAERKLKFVGSFYGIIDLLVIIPFVLPFVGYDFSFLRVVRFFRIFKIFRYSKTIDRFARVFGGIKNELVLTFIMSLFLLYIASAGIYYFEHKAQPEVFTSIPSSFWWATTTLTTVGYGDSYPITTGGKVFTFLVLMVGLGLVAIPSGLIASGFSKVNTEE